MSNVGDPAPEFELKSDSGSTVRLADLRGKKVILYFYPRDDTPGCTIQACEFRDRQAEIEQGGAVVLGVSPDGIESHQRFKAKFDLPFALLADRDHAVAEAYGAWGEKERSGKTYEGIFRTTYVIDEEGIIAQVFENVQAEGHGDEVLSSLDTER